MFTTATWNAKRPRKQNKKLAARQDKICWKKPQWQVWFEAARFEVLRRYRTTTSAIGRRNLNGALPLGVGTHPKVSVVTRRPVICYGQHLYHHSGDIPTTARGFLVTWKMNCGCTRCNKYAKVAPQGYGKQHISITKTSHMTTLSITKWSLTQHAVWPRLWTSPDTKKTLTWLPHTPDDPSAGVGVFRGCRWKLPGTWWDSVVLFESRVTPDTSVLASDIAVIIRRVF